MPFPSHGDATKSFEPGEEALDLPASLVPTQGAAILRSTAGFGAFGGNELDVALDAEALSEVEAVEGFVANQFVRHRRYGLVESVFDERHIVAGTIRNANGDWKTSAVCKRHDLCRLAGTASSDAGPPFLAGM